MPEQETTAWDLRQSRIEFIGKLVNKLYELYIEAKQDKYSQQKQLDLLDTLDVLWRVIRLYCDDTNWSWNDTEQSVQKWLDKIENKLEREGVAPIELEKSFKQLRSLYDHIEDKRVNEAELDIPITKEPTFDATQ